MPFRFGGDAVHVYLTINNILRDNRDLLLKAMADPTTPANALPAISRQLIDVCERIEALQGGGLTDLLDDEEDEVTDDVGASIV